MTPETTQRETPTPRPTSRADALAAMVGGRLGTLAVLYGRGAPLDASRVDGVVRGRFLASTVFGPAEFAFRGLVRFVSAHAMPWEGITFDHGGNAGANIVLGKKAIRFRAERGTSLVDERPTLVMTYDKNPWPARLLRDELRVIEPGLGIGPTFVRVGDVPRLVGWFGVVGDF